MILTGSADLWTASASCSTCNGVATFSPSQSSTATASTKPFSITYGSGSASGTLITVSGFRKKEGGATSYELTNAVWGGIGNGQHGRIQSYWSFCWYVLFNRKSTVKGFVEADQKSELSKKKKRGRHEPNWYSPNCVTRSFRNHGLVLPVSCSTIQELMLMVNSRTRFPVHQLIRNKTFLASLANEQRPPRSQFQFRSRFGHHFSNHSSWGNYDAGRN